MPEDPEHRIKRLQMRSNRRGIKEMDLILGGFAQTQLEGRDDAWLQTYDAMLNENDHDLYQWVTGKQAPPAQFDDVIGDIKAGL
ncbi:MAG: succinate dehydrogenase assembly factor 2 [Pseudomonadota bacterium]